MAHVNWWTVLLLIISNGIMLYAWYGHLKTMSGKPLWMIVVVSWLIALVEYCFAVPANKLGSKTMSLEQLKIVQEAVALLTFVPFSLFVMHQQVSWNYVAASACIFAAVFFIFWK